MNFFSPSALRGRFLILALSFSVGVSRAADETLPLVKSVDLAQFSPADFADADLDLPYYLQHFHTLANSVESSGPNRGTFHLNVWRKTDAPYNMRVQENILSLAWFYCAKQKWNVYRGDPAVRARLEAALDHWCRAQLPDGQFAEYAPGVGDLAATAFASKFIGEALVLLHDGPPINPELMTRALAADRKAIVKVLTDEKFYQHGVAYTNQYGGVWVGGLNYFEIKPDSELRTLWDKVYRRSLKDFHSPAGYYYEKNGPDFGYTMDTTGHNNRAIWPLLRGTPDGDELIRVNKLWFDWLAHNAPPEPDGSGFVLNRAIETRQRHAAFATYETSLGEEIPQVRAFSETDVDQKARYDRQRAELKANWPKVAPLVLGEMEAFGPYAFLHRRLKEWVPTAAQREEGRKLLPMIARDRFTQQRRDSNEDAVYTFARRPGYYAIFNSGGKVISFQQRYGLGLVWTPELGTVLQSQTASSTADWGVQPEDDGLVEEAEGARASFSQGKKKLPTPAVGVHELPEGDISANYSSGGSRGTTVTFADDAIHVTIERHQKFKAILPLLVPADGRLVVTPGRVTLETPRGNFVVSFDPSVGVTTMVTHTNVLKKHVEVVTLSGSEVMSYTMGGK